MTELQLHRTTFTQDMDKTVESPLSDFTLVRDGKEEFHSVINETYRRIQTCFCPTDNI